MRLLFITYTRVGDAVLSTGLLDHLIRQSPGIKVTIVCGPAAAPLFEAVPGLERIISLEKKTLSLHWITMWLACWNRYWDVAIDLRNTPWTYVLATGYRRRMGRVADNVHRITSLARIVSLEAQPPAPRIWTSDLHHQRASQLIPDGPPVLAIGPTANWVAKTWRAENFAELVGRLTAPANILANARIAVFGHESEREMARTVIESLAPERCIDLVGRIPLLDVFACLQRTAFYVGNDSGLMHMAATAGVPTLGLFGPSREELYAPWGERCATVRPPVSYENIFPADFDHRNSDTLMDGLSVDAVERAAQTLWQRARQAA